MILIINTSKELLHYFEFVKPIEDILKKDNVQYRTIPVNEISKYEIDCADRIIICGTSLKDFEYLKYIDRFSFITDKQFYKPILGICAGMQIICTLFGFKLEKGNHIGPSNVKFDNFLGYSGDKEVYELHNMIVEEDENFRRTFEIKAKNKYIQAIKHRKKPIYATLFHPEVRNQEIIQRFISKEKYSHNRTRAS